MMLLRELLSNISHTKHGPNASTKRLFLDIFQAVSTVLGHSIAINIQKLRQKFAVTLWAEKNNEK